MKITINGKIEEIDTPRNLDQLIRSTAEKNQGLLVQLNNKIVKPDQWKTQEIHEDDVVEFFKIVGGG